MTAQREPALFERKPGNRIALHNSSKVFSYDGQMFILSKDENP